ncbi:MAG: hypothetical protein MR025_01445 [Helicobacter trogontum]|uniref:hypothetical protein n=1 Tax=Helicobacter trogontum TaxID=50960 RepID=UPI0024305FEF|nr:hypothetical protein [Helicobacter trogontum]MCI5786107.1 hypothetical protein [Helicobacter trogontum]
MRMIYFIFGIFVIVLLNGCSFSFKYIDPQYYEFKRLCKEAKNVIYDEELYRIDKARYNKERYYDENTQKEYLMSDFTIAETYSKDITKRLKDREATWYYHDKPFYKEKYYWYNYKGLFLQGDEAAGWHWETQQRLLCENNETLKR